MGRREASKRATRQALQDAAGRLFAQHGFTETTVREIAEAAGVTERTFFRYFDSKEELIIDDIFTAVRLLKERIRGRPAQEPPMLAVERAVSDLLQESGLDGDQVRVPPTLLFQEGPPGARLGRSGARAMLRIEEEFAEAIRDRADAGQDAGRVALAAQVKARCAVAVLRTVAIRSWELRQVADADRPLLPDLVHDAFSAVLAGEHGAG